MTATPGTDATVSAVPVDTAGGAALAAASAELIGPLATAARPEPLPWVAAADPPRVAVGGTRLPLVLVTLLGDLAGDTVVVTPTVLPAGGALPPLRFAPYTQSGTALVAHVPATDDGGAAAPFELRVTAARVTATGTETLDPDEVRAAMRVELVQGRLGRLLLVLLAEKGRLRREGREILAMRRLATAHGDALDRIGADLRSPRFADELVWDPERRSPSTQALTPPGTREADAAYRDRLATLRGFRLPTPVWMGDALEDADLPQVAVDESLNELPVAVRLVAPGSAHGRARLLDAVRRTHLIWPADSTTGDAVHDARLVTQLEFDRTRAARVALAAWHLPDGQPVAPGLALALQALDGRCTQLGARPWPALLAGQLDEGGSRFELGLGALFTPPEPAMLDAAVAAGQVLGDPELVPRSRDDDPAGAWLLRACGLRTVVSTTDGAVFVSTTSMGALVVDLTPSPDAPVPLTLSAHLEAERDPAHDAPMADVIDRLTAEGLAAAPTPADVLAGVQPTATQPDLANALLELDLPMVTAEQDFAGRMVAVSLRDYAVFDLGPARTAQVVVDSGVLADLLAVAARAGASSVVPVVTAAGTLALVLAVVGLPLGGNNLAARHALLHRWQVRALAGEPLQLEPRRGPVTVAQTPGEGISLVSCLVHLRTGRNDPYEWRPALPEGALLTLRQYEHLMNVVEQVTPVGVRADTWAIRQQHVDVDGSGVATPLTPSAARAYRRYRSR